MVTGHGRPMWGLAGYCPTMMVAVFMRVIGKESAAGLHMTTTGIVTATVILDVIAAGKTSATANNNLRVNRMRARS